LGKYWYFTTYTSFTISFLYIIYNAQKQTIRVLGQYQAVVTLRAVVSPGRTLRLDGKETTASNRLFAIEHACPRDDYEYPTRRLGNENFNKTIDLISKTTLHVHQAFIFAFVCHF